MLESKIEREVTKHAKKCGMNHYKFTSPAQRGVPDSIYLFNGYCFFIEFKQAGKTPRKLQQAKIAQIVKQGFDVFIVDDIAMGILIINNIVDKHAKQK